MENQGKNQEASLAIVRSGEDSAPDPLAWLDAAEKYALEKFLDKRDNSVSSRLSAYSLLGPSVVEGMAAVYIKGGRTLSEIRSLYPQYSLGQIVYAAVDGNWHLRRTADIALTAQRAKIRAELAILEGMDLAADAVAVIKKMHGDSLQRYLASGNEKDLEGTSPVVVLRQLKEAAAVIAQLTGKDQVKRIAVTGSVSHVVASLPTAPPAAPDPGEESGILDAWAKVERGKMEKDQS